MKPRQWIYACDGFLAKRLPTSGAVSAFALTIAVVYGVALAVFKLLPLNDALAFGGMLVAVFLSLSHGSDKTRSLTLHAVTQIIVLSWIASLWTLGYEGRTAVFGGIIPWSDSGCFLNDALRLDHGQLMEISAKRPIFPTTLAVLLRVFDGNLRLVLLILGMFSAFTVALATNAVWKTHGRRAAIVVFALLLLSLRHWAGEIQTEDVGLPFGLIGFSLIWKATAARDSRLRFVWPMVLAGLFSITVALMARAGAFFILPALAIWSALYVVPAQSSRKLRFGYFLAAMATLAAGAGVHEFLLHSVAAGMSFSDYPPIVYGLMHHRDFTLLLEQHPELAALSGAARATAAWQIVIAEAQAHPGMLIGGFARSFAELFYTPNGLFGFVWRNPDDILLENGAAVRAAIAQYGVLGPVRLWIDGRGVYSLFNALTMAIAGICWVIAAIAALIALYRGPADRFKTLLRWAIGGVLLSAPFTPPWITSAHQVETATLTFMAVTIATWRLREGRNVPVSGMDRTVWLAPCFSGVLMLSALALLTWPNKTEAHAMRIYPSTLVRVVPARTLELSLKSEGDLWFSTQYLKKHNAEFTASLTPFLRPGTVYVLAYDADAGNTKVLVDDRALLDPRGGWTRLKGVPQIEPLVLHVTSVEP